MVNSPFEDNYDENDDEHNQIELVMPALNMIQKFTTIFVHCHVTSSSHVFATKKRLVFFERISRTLWFISEHDNLNLLHSPTRHLPIILQDFSPI